MWFHNEMEMENIEYFFNPILRTYKKQYLIRAYVQQPKHIKNLKSLQIYDENENVLTLNDVTKENKIISIVEGLGIKFTSSSFHLELCLRQVMVLEDKPLFEKCLIQTGRTPFITEHTNVPLISQNTSEEQITQSPDNINSDIQLIDPSNQELNLEETKQVNDEQENDTDVTIKSPIQNSTPDKENIELDINEKEGDIATDTEDENEEASPAISGERKEQQNEEVGTPPSPIKEEETLDKKGALCEIDLEIPPNEDPIHLKNPIEVYRELYSRALQKAQEARKQYIQAFLEAKNIKNTFLSNEIEDSDDDLENFEEILE